jgi:hypothetical protein
MIIKTGILLAGNLIQPEFSPLDIPQSNFSKNIKYEEFCLPLEMNKNTLNYNVIDMEYINNYQNNNIINDILIKSIENYDYKNKP